MGQRVDERPGARLVSEETERELRQAAQELSDDPTMPGIIEVPLDLDAPPVFPGALEQEPNAIAAGPIIAKPPQIDLESLLAEFDAEQEEASDDDEDFDHLSSKADNSEPINLSIAIDGTEPDDVAAQLPPVVAPVDDPLAPQLPLSLEEPPPVTRIAMDQLLPDPKALESLRKLAGAAGHPERTHKALTSAFTGKSYDPRHLPDARVMLVGIARVLVEHGLPANEMIEAIMASLTD